MGCCNKQRKKFVNNISKAKEPETRNIKDIPDAELSPRKLRIKNRAIRIEKRTKRIERRNARATAYKAKSDRKALDN